MSEELGEVYVVQPPFRMSSTYAESSPATPIFFTLFPGVDPTSWVEAIGERETRRKEKRREEERKDEKETRETRRKKKKKKEKRRARFHTVLCVMCAVSCALCAMCYLLLPSIALR